LENSELIHAVKRKLKSGYPAGEIKTQLREAGISEEDIDAIFNATVSASSSGEGIYRHESPGNQIFLLGGAGLIITGLAFLSLASESSIGMILTVVGAIMILPFIFKRIAREFERK
jgi:hypothetical protein